MSARKINPEKRVKLARKRGLILDLEAVRQAMRQELERRTVKVKGMRA